MQRIDALARVVESTASAAKAPAVDPWQNTKAVLLNVLSNRLDAWLFGNGKGSVGFAVQVVAVLALVIALIRLMLAIAMFNPATPPTKWGQFKAWTRKNPVVRAINVLIGALAVAFTGVVLYVVMSARAAPDVAQASFSALQESLQACQTTLSKTSQLQQLIQTPPSTGTPPLSQEALDRLGKSCDTAIRDTNQRLKELQNTITTIEAKQPWTLTKIIAFLASAYLVVAVTALLVQRFGK
jgi:hypothetical protein